MLLRSVGTKEIQVPDGQEWNLGYEFRIIRRGDNATVKDNESLLGPSHVRCQLLETRKSATFLVAQRPAYLVFDGCVESLFAQYCLA